MDNLNLYKGGSLSYNRILSEFEILNTNFTIERFEEIIISLENKYASLEIRCNIDHSNSSVEYKNECNTKSIELEKYSKLFQQIYNLGYKKWPDPKFICVYKENGNCLDYKTIIKKLTPRLSNSIGLSGGLYNFYMRYKPK